MGLKFIRCEDGSFVHVDNVTRLAVETDYTDKAKIQAHHNGHGMPFTVAEFETSREACTWLTDLIDRIELPSYAPLRSKPISVSTLEDTE